MKHIVTKDSMIKFLSEKEKDQVIQYIGRALVHLFNRQVDDEKSDNNTKYHNMRGFMPCDAKSGSITAKYFLKHKTLLDWQVEAWTKDFRGSPRIAKYWRQLDEVAQKRMDS